MTVAPMIKHPNLVSAHYRGHFMHQQLAVYFPTAKASYYTQASVLLHQIQNMHVCVQLV